MCNKHGAMYILHTFIFIFLQVYSDTSVDIFSYGVLLFQLLTHEKVDVDSVDLTGIFNAGMVGCCSVLKIIIQLRLPSMSTCV